MANLARQASARLLGFLMERHEWMFSKTKDGSRTFFDTNDYPWVSELEANVAVIQEELERVVLRRVDLVPNFQDVQEEQRTLTTDDRWKTFVFYGYGLRAEQNCLRCPNTTRLLQKIPGMTSAMFSILRGRKHIPPHRGPYKGVLRYHMALRVPGPKGSCRIRVGPDTAAWEEGKSLIFDDTHDHEAWNDTDENRVILFVDFLRPAPFPLSATNAGIVKVIGRSPFIRQGLTNIQKWEADVGAEFDRKD